MKVKISSVKVNSSDVKARSNVKGEKKHKQAMT
jgi:hypothetical protein